MVDEQAAISENVYEDQTINIKLNGTIILISLATSLHNKKFYHQVQHLVEM
jgi:hypothetical protein